jgi:hypothetical protein
MSASRPCISNPASAEAIASWMMADLCYKVGLRSVLVEGDLVEVVTALKRGGDCSERYGYFVDEARQLLRTMEHWNVQHVGREPNNVAHQLAQYEATLEEECIWTTNFPDFLLPFVLFDLHVS